MVGDASLDNVRESIANHADDDEGQDMELQILQDEKKEAKARKGK